MPVSRAQRRQRIEVIRAHLTLWRVEEAVETDDAARHTVEVLKQISAQFDRIPTHGNEGPKS